MANYTTSANVVVSINGKQALQMLRTLEKEANRLERQITKAAAAGDKVKVTKLQRELNQVRKTMDQVRGASQSVEQTLARLDRASPKELNRALRTLQQQLNGIQRGTTAWDAHVAKIRMVKTELQKVNATLATQETMWRKFNKTLNYCQTAIMAVIAAVTGLVMAGRRAVKAYADMEEAMTNTQKYTRMTREQVEELNDTFKKMDTRIAREELNALAQEGGRLGYNTVKSVQEYVEAASIIKVALVDLGEGATQTIAKISNIFGMEEMYGTRDAMLKVGSTVNHLSQNCTASKPYLVEFAQRLAGIGSTAKMTIPEILAFGATLDAHGQKVEMASTALQRTIMALFKDTAGMAKKVGLDVKDFTVTLNRSTTDGVMQFLEALHKLGEDRALAILSPLFKDLGLDGVRVSGVLANLSSHLDFLKWQLGEAADAFRDGTSATKEYELFNNTAQAKIEKAKNKVHELAVELGEKLYPVMAHIYTSSGVFLRVLNHIVTFIVNNKNQIAALVTVIGSYYVGLVAAKAITLLWAGAVHGATMVVNSFKYMVGLGRVAVTLFTKGITAANVSLKALNQTLKMNPFGMIVTAITAAYLVISRFLPKVDEFKEKMRECVNIVFKYNAELERENINLSKLFETLKRAKKGTEEYNKAKNELMSKYGQYLKGLINERGEITNLTKAYRRLAEAVRLANHERGIQEAKNAVYEAFSGQMNDYFNQLSVSLLAYGASQEEAARIAAAVSVAMNTGGTVPDDVAARLNALSRNTPNANYAKGFLANLSPGSMNSAIGELFGVDQIPQPAQLINNMYDARNMRQTALDEIDIQDRQMRPLGGLSDGMLEVVLRQYERFLAGETDTIVKIDDAINGVFAAVKGTRDEAERIYEQLAAEMAYRKGKPVTGNNSLPESDTDFNYDDYTPYESEADRKKREREEAAAKRREEIKARKEFKAELNNAKGDWELADAINTQEYNQGLKTWTEYLLKKHQLELKYYDDRKKVFEKWGLQEDEDYQELLKKRAEYEKQWNARYAALQVADVKRRQTREENALQVQYNTPGSAIYQKEEEYNRKLFDIRKKAMEEMQKVYQQNTEEWYNYSLQIEEAELAEQLRRQKLYAQKIEEWRREYEYQSAKDRMNLEMALLEEIHARKLISEEEYERAKADLKKKYARDYMPESAKPDRDSAEQRAIQMKKDLDVIKSLYDQVIIDKEQYEKAKKRIEDNYRKKAEDVARKFGSTETNQLLDIYQAWKDFFNKTEEDGENWATRLGKLAGAVFAVMASGIQMASEFMAAQTELEVARIEKKYDREIELAEGNSYRVNKAEKKKEEEIAKIKNEANRKQFAMQVIQAIAQTATNALMAYGSALAVPAVGWILAPIAASMAVAAGAMQIATLKKQQQASEAQGYMSGGFTPDGRPDEVAGVVHAGEWVASQKLVNNPRTRPLIEALDYAQRTNTIGSIRMADVSRSVTAPMVLASREEPQVVVATTPAPTVVVEQNKEYAQTMRRLSERLDEPMVSVVTITGDKGIQKAQDDYDKLLRNKSPKSKR